MLKRILLLTTFLFLIFSLINYNYAVGLLMNLESNTNSNLNSNSESNTSSYDDTTYYDVQDQSFDYEDSTNYNEEIGASLSTLENYEDTSDALSLSTITNIILIAVGIVLVLLGIAIIIKLK